MHEVNLYPNQEDALSRMHNACVLRGDVGTGKSITGLAYVYIKELGGSIKPFKEPTISKDLYIITTAQKRDSLEWDKELLRFGLSTNKDESINGIKCTIDSWNNIKKYTKIYGAIFIFDEQHALNWGAWGKSFVRISRRNHWILLTGTPGDSWKDFMPIFIACGFYKNKTDFNMQHVVLKPYMNYPVIDHYVNQGKLLKCKRQVLVEMESERKVEKKKFKVNCNYSKEKYKLVWRSRWNPYDDCPIEETGKLCYLLRRIVNEDEDRIKNLFKVLDEHPRSIIFYNFSPELHLLEKRCKENRFKVAGWNGEHHDPLPEGDKWVYLCQYTAASEGWNCIATDTIIFYSLSYSYKQMVQAAGRIDRTNTPFKVLYYFYLESFAPIDLAIKKALLTKRNFNEKHFLAE